MKLIEISKNSWVIKDDENSLGLLTKFNGTYSLLMNGSRKRYKTNPLPKNLFKDVSKYNMERDKHGYINGFPVNYQDFICIEDGSAYPVFKKSLYSDIIYCAGYYSVNFNNTWIPLFCPKLKTLQKYTSIGPCKDMGELSDEISRFKKEKTRTK